MPVSSMLHVHVKGTMSHRHVKTQPAYQIKCQHNKTKPSQNIASILLKTFARNLSREYCQHFAREIMPEILPVIFGQSLSNNNDGIFIYYVYIYLINYYLDILSRFCGPAFFGPVFSGPFQTPVKPPSTVHFIGNDKLLT